MARYFPRIVRMRNITEKLKERKSIVVVHPATTTDFSVKYIETV
jgi:hypothetical protein